MRFNSGTFGTLDVDWNSTNTYLLLDPRLGTTIHSKVKNTLSSEIVNTFPDHFFLASSGTSTKEDQLKIVALSKKAILTSAQAVNDHLEVSSSDSWATFLPDFHVGGIGIHARANLIGIPVTRGPGNSAPWDYKKAHEVLTVSRCTLTSFVPTQLYDFVQAEIKAPKSLRAIVVGGSALDPALYESARRLGWPILPSYGMSECSSQVATATLSSLDKTEFPDLALLEHMQIQIMEGVIALKSQALLSSYIYFQDSEVSVKDPKNEGWFLSSDIGEYNSTKGTLRVAGRSSDFVKIGAEGVWISDLEIVLAQAMREVRNKGPFSSADAAIAQMPDPRLGTRIVLFTTDLHFGEQVQVFFNERVLPFAIIRDLVHVSEIKRSALGKVIKQSLIKD